MSYLRTPYTPAPWVMTCTGRRHYLGGMEQWQIANTPSIIEVAHHLAHTNRYLGAAARAVSVAEHSLLCARIAWDMGMARSAVLACLMHDAHEAFAGDVRTPVKAMLGIAWLEIENRAALHVAKSMGHYVALQAHRAAVRQVDLIALATERRDLFPASATDDGWPDDEAPCEWLHLYVNTSSEREPADMARRLITLYGLLKRSDTIDDELRPALNLWPWGNQCSASPRERAAQSAHTVAAAQQEHTA